MRVTINTQTPPVRFTSTYRDLLEKYGDLTLPVDLSLLSENDFQLAVGGVARMMLALIRRMNLGKTKWVALGPGYPPQVALQNVELHLVDLPPNVLSLYTKFKEGLYNEAHGISKYNIAGQEYIAYATYNWYSANKLLEFYLETDVYFVNDFQQLLVGGIIGPSAPALLWYHIPFIPDKMGDRTREFLIRSFEGFDLVVLSTKRDLEGLVRAGGKVKAKQIYPFIDPQSYERPSSAELQSTLDKYRIENDEKVVLLVGRMDPIKSQDVAIKAIKKLNARLILAGNGSFTSKTLGHDKASLWVKKLRGLVEELGVRDKVIFTGYVTEKELASLYVRSDVVILTSRTEGFGLTVCEAWNYQKPVVVSKGAGVSELVIDGVNGYTFNPDSSDELAEAIQRTFKEGEKMGSMGKETLRQCSLDYAVEKVKEAMEEAMKGYPKRGTD